MGNRRDNLLIVWTCVLCSALHQLIFLLLITDPATVYFHKYVSMYTYMYPKRVITLFFLSIISKFNDASTLSFHWHKIQHQLNEELVLPKCLSQFQALTQKLQMKSPEVKLRITYCNTQSCQHHLGSSCKVSNLLKQFSTQALNVIWWHFIPE